MLEKIVKKMRKFFKKRYESYQVWLLKILGATIGKNVRIRGKIFIHGNPSNLTLGDDCSINEGVILNCRDKIVIGSRTHISAFTQIHTGALILDVLPREHRKGEILIGEDVWIAAQCIINPSVSIADRCVIGGNSTVTQNISQSDTFYAGNPAKFIKNIDYVVGA